jgi:long-chain fatty acid transport protein
MKSKFVFTVFAVISAPLTHAAGFYLKEQSVVSQGVAFAGAAARQDAASSVYFNPAGIAGMNSQIEGGAHLLMPDQKVTGTTALGGLSTATQTPLDNSLIPNFYYTRPIGEGVFGFGISAPFGSKNEYSTGFIGALDSYYNKLKTVDYSFAYGREVSDQVRLGAALVYQTADIKQSKRLSPLSASTATLEGDSSAIGLTLGVQTDLDSGGTLGISWKKAIDQDITGTNTISATIPGVGAAGTYNASGTLKLPSMLSVSLTKPISDTTNLLVDITRYGWGRYDKLDVTTNFGGVLSTSSSPQNYIDTTAYAIGLEHTYGNGYVARAGVHFDPTPTNDTDRSFSTPDGDRTWLAFGVSKTTETGLTWDFAYTHIQLDDTSLNRAITGVGTASATAESSFNIISIGLRMPLD